MRLLSLYLRFLWLVLISLFLPSATFSTRMDACLKDIKEAQNAP
jgi:hypothetical protein